MGVQPSCIIKGALAASAALLVVVACGGGGKGPAPVPSVPASSPTGIPAATPTSTTSAKSASLPQDFQLSLYQGSELLGGSEAAFSQVLARGKPVVLNFWAGLCPPCRAEMPDLQQVYGAYMDRVLLVGVDVGPFLGLGSREDGRRLLKELGIRYPAATTFDPKVVRSYQIFGMPTTYFFKPNGQAIRKWTGLLTKGKMAELVEELVAASAKG